MATLPTNASEATVQEYVDNVVGNSHDLKKRWVATRKHKDAEAEAVRQLEKAAREAAADAKRKELIDRAQAAEAARKALNKKIQKEMAEATKKQALWQSNRDKAQWAKGLAQRKENLHRLHLAETDRLRSEAEIANERREGTSMNKGSKSDFLTAMRSSGKADDKEFV